MAKAKKAPGATDLQNLEADLKARGLEYSLLEYSHAYVDVLFKDEEGTKQKLEYRPDGSEIHRDEFGIEVAE